MQTVSSYSATAAMELTQERLYFGTVDLVVFIGLLVLALLVGIFYAIKDRQKNDTDTYYFGGRKLSPIPVGLSIAVTFISALTVIGFPTEAYGYGSVTLWYGIGLVIPKLVACIYYIPLIHRLALSSIYEYLELRFHKGVRQVESVISIISLVLYLGTTIYLPSLALNAVTPISISWNILLLTTVCIIYTTLGGMKAVVWTDTLQTFIMFAGMLAAFIKAVTDVGGVQKVSEAIERGQRQTFLNFDPDMTMPYTFWTIIVGFAFRGSGSCVNQSISQRYLSCKSVYHARIAALVALIPGVVFMSLAAGSGCAMYAYFEGCDPLKTGRIKKADQLMPLLVVTVFKDVPGMAGLFISAAFSGTLSTVSSGINAVGALILQDFILPKWPKLSIRSQMMISKVTVALFGLIAMCYAFCIQFINATIIQVGNIVSGVMGGPLLAVFTLGIFFPWCTTKGVLTGQIVGTVFMAWVAVSSFVYGKPPEKYAFLPTSTDQCIESTTMWTNTTVYTSTMDEFTTASHVAETVEPRPVIQDTLFAISHFHYTMVAFAITVTVALFASFLTGANKPQYMDPKLFVPMVDNQCLPEKVRLFFRFGVPEYRNESTALKHERKNKQQIENVRSSARDGEDDVLMKTSVI